MLTNKATNEEFSVRTTTTDKLITFMNHILEIKRAVRTKNELKHITI